MKILFLNPHIDAQHKIAQALKARGMALIISANPDEGWQILKLHGKSIDLAIVHREGIKGGDPGVELLAKIKKDASQEDLPVIFTSEAWSADQCAGHQQTALGANAYLRWPFDENDLLKTIDAIFEGESESGAPVELARPALPSTGEVVLEEPSVLAADSNAGSASISLEAPPDVSEELQVERGSSSEGIDISMPISTSDSVSVPSVPIPTSEVSVLELSVMPIAPATATSAEVSQSPEVEEVQVVEPAVEVQDSELAAEMPYLFAKPDMSKSVALDSAVFARAFAQPVGNSVVPGGAANAPDADTLKKYLLLREQDVAALSAQLKASQDEVSTLKAQLSAERSHGEELQFSVSDQKRKIEDFEREKALALEGLQAELQELRFQNKAKTDKAKLLDAQVREASAEIERLKERVRSDIRKIRVRERELENKLEISKKDSEAILTSRENKIIELKRKLDLLEFNMDLLQDRYSREKEGSAKLREKLAKAAQVVRVAEGLLDEPAAAKGPGTPEDTKAS